MKAEWIKTIGIEATWASRERERERERKREGEREGARARESERETIGSEAWCAKARRRLAKQTMMG